MASIQFQLDEHLDNAIAHELQRLGVAISTPMQAGLRTAPDVDYLTRCLEEHRVIVTNDRGFLRVNAEGHPHAGIVFWRHGTRTIGQIVEGLQLIYEVYQAGDMIGRVYFL